MRKYDLAIIGGGPCGYSAAIRAAQLGLSTCLYEPESLGGTCLNRGCIPTKALYRSAEVYTEAKNSEIFGVECDSVKLRYHDVLKRKDEIVSNLVSGIGRLIERDKIDLIQERVTVSEAVMQADKVIIATGSKPAPLSIPGTDLPGVMNSDELLSHNKVPDRLAIIGGGVIGIEFAGIFSAFGSEVTVFEFLPDILPSIDKEIRKRFIPILKKQGITVITGSKVKAISTENNDKPGSLTLKAETSGDDMNLETDTILIATGRIPHVETLALDDVGIEYDRSGIRTDKNGETTKAGVYAAGDVTGGIMLAHVAAEEGIRLAERIAAEVVDNGSQSQDNEENGKAIPGCIFSFPEIAYAGITEEEAKNQGIKYKIGKFMFGANGKALCHGENRGLVKVITDSEGVLRGVHILGPHASDLIHEGVLAIEKGFRAEDLAHVIHAHPTLGECFHEAVLDAENKAIHKA